MAKIAGIVAREIMNFMGNPGVEVDVALVDGTIGRAVLPGNRFHSSDKVIKDGKSRIWQIDKGVLAARTSINNLFASKVVGMDALNQAGVDHAMMEFDDLRNKESLGINATLGISLAVAKAAAASINMPLYQYLGGCHNKQMPATMMNMLSGGKYSCNNLDFREFMIVPVGTVSFAEAMLQCRKVYHTLKSILKGRDRSTSMGSAGGFVPKLVANEEALAILLRAIKQAGYQPGKQIALAFNAAASDFFKDGVYNLPGEGFIKTPAEMVEYYTGLVEEYPIISIQEGIAREDQEGWSLFFQCLGGKIQLVNHEFWPPQFELLQQGRQSKAGKAIVLKVNQLATLSDIFDVVGRVKRAGCTCIISSCSNETADAGIADIAVGVNAAQIKGNALGYAEQVGVYNQLLRIEEDLGRCKNQQKMKTN